MGQKLDVLYGLDWMTQPAEIPADGDVHTVDVSPGDDGHTYPEGFNYALILGVVEAYVIDYPETYGVDGVVRPVAPSFSYDPSNPPVTEGSAEKAATVTFYVQGNSSGPDSDFKCTIAYCWTSLNGARITLDIGYGPDDD